MNKNTNTEHNYTVQLQNTNTKYKYKIQVQNTNANTDIELFHTQLAQHLSKFLCVIFVLCNLDMKEADK